MKCMATGQERPEGGHPEVTRVYDGGKRKFSSLKAVNGSHSDEV